MTRLFIVRHGNTFDPGDVPRRIGARSDPSLTASGRLQAQALGIHFRNQDTSFSCAYASSLKRTRETAQVILDVQQGPEMATAEWLMEIDHGPDEGMVEPQVAARLGASALASWDSDVIAPDGWHVDAKARIAGWRSLLRSPPPGDTLLVTSSGAARFIFLALPIRRPAAGLKLRTGSYGTLEKESDGWRLIDWDIRPAP